MGVVIEATAVSRPTRRPTSHGARRLADEAARTCLRTAGRAHSDVDMLINAGVYRERGLGEPALAALIQQDVDLNPGDFAGGGHGTFSFDIDNGMCGALTGADVLRSFITSGAIELGLVVASDSAPGPIRARWLPYPEAGAAMLLSRDAAVEGFAATRFTTFPEYADLAEGYWQWRASRLRGRHGVHGYNRLMVVERPGFRQRATDCAADSTGKFLADLGVAVSDVDLLVATPGPGLADPLADQLGIPHARTLHTGEQLGAMHSAQPIAAIDLARRSGRWNEARTILIVAAGSGITVANALYRH